MKEFLRFSTVFAALAACGSAHAGFLDPAPAYPVPAAGYPGYPVKSSNTIPPVYDWTGFYVGINGGGSWGHVPWSSDPDGTNGSVPVSSGLVGGTIGYNAQNLGRFVGGEEFDFDWRGINASVPAASCVLNCEFKSRWLSTTRLRFGYAFDRFLPYVTGGLSIGDVNQDVVMWTPSAGPPGPLS
jgi:opacity protein-like surface antigen